MSEKVAIYCRVSTQMQTTDRQKDDLRNVAERFGYSIDDDNIFIDIISGFSIVEDRPRYSALLNKVEKGEIDTILFSELTRLGRNSTELLAEIERLQAMGANLYFDKQDFWVKTEKTDIGTRILLSVLAVTTTYEIELFAERSISGKINKLKQGGGVGGDNNAYGYRNDENKKMVIREDEAEVIRRIFSLYAEGMSTLEISEILNAEHIPTSYDTRINEFRANRKKKGISPKEYQFDDRNLRWRPSAISKILSKELYRGHRVISFHRPNVTKKEAKNEILYTFDEHIEDLRIISDELFYRVQERLQQAPYNKNNAIKHDNLLKTKLVCGECGSRFSVGKQTDTAKNYKCNPRTYMCYGRVNRKDKPRTCIDGAEVRQCKLDGLVVTLCLKYFADLNMKNTTEKKVRKLLDEISIAENVKQDKNNELNTITENYKKVIRRLSLMEKSEDVVLDLMKNEENKFVEKSKQLQTDISKHTKEISTKTALIKKLKNLSEQYTNIREKMHEIRADRDLLKNMVEEYIDKIVLYRIHPKWVLVVISFFDSSEFWGTLKCARYKYNEMFFDEIYSQYGIEFQSWWLDNSSQCFSYKKDKHTVTYNGQNELYSDIPQGTYSFSEFDAILHEKEWIGSFPLYSLEQLVYKPNSAFNR